MENIFETLGGILQPDKNNTMEYTKGKWIITDEIHIESENGLSIATVFWNSLHHHTTMVPKSEGLANIKLIAAAPDLLKALDDAQKVINTLILGTPTGSFRDELTELNIKALTAIKKATS